MPKFSPFRWDCDKQGCFNTKCRPDFGVFYDCFPGKGSFTDIDGIIEINGKLLLLEWKSKPDTIPVGQQIMYKHLSRKCDAFVVCVSGDAETMQIDHALSFSKGHMGRWIPISTEQVVELFTKWAAFAKGGKESRNVRQGQ